MDPQRIRSLRLGEEQTLLLRRPLSSLAVHDRLPCIKRVYALVHAIRSQIACMCKSIISCCMPIQSGA